MTAPNLADGVGWVEAALGVPMQPGGRHPAMATHNALLRLSDSSYLEVIAIDPDAPPPMRARWFALDDLAPDDQPRLATWVVRVDDLDAAAADSSEPLGEILDMSRGPFAWRITVPTDGRPPFDGLMPALIDWSTAHPASSLVDRGCRLLSLEARHPDPDRLRRGLRSLDAHEVAVAAATSAMVPRLAATLLTPAGIRRLAVAT